MCTITCILQLVHGIHFAWSLSTILLQLQKVIEHHDTNITIVAVAHKAVVGLQNYTHIIAGNIWQCRPLNVHIELYRMTSLMHSTFFMKITACLDSWMAFCFFFYFRWPRLPVPGLKRTVVPTGEMLYGLLRRVAWAAFLAAVLDRALKAILGYERGTHNYFGCAQIYIQHRKILHSHYWN